MPPFFIFVLLAQAAAAAAAEDTTIHISLSVTALASLGLIVFREFRPKRNGSDAQRRCGTEELIYWERMEEHVTRPICDAIARDRAKGHGAGR